MSSLCTCHIWAAGLTGYADNMILSKKNNIRMTHNQWVLRNALISSLGSVCNHIPHLMTLQTLPNSMKYCIRTHPSILFRLYWAKLPLIWSFCNMGCCGSEQPSTNQQVGGFTALSTQSSLYNEPRSHKHFLPLSERFLTLTHSAEQLRVSILSKGTSARRLKQSAIKPATFN